VSSTDYEGSTATRSHRVKDAFDVRGDDVGRQRIGREVPVSRVK
jgi:hypothetical protein